MMNIDEIPTPETDAAFPLSENWHYPDSDEYLMRMKTSTKSALQVPLARLVRPRRETPKWLRLGSLLDEIHRQADDEAIHQGFVHGKTSRLDAALERIQKAATEARAILRPTVNNPNQS
jgi:hypothetical protein